MMLGGPFKFISLLFLLSWNSRRTEGSLTDWSQPKQRSILTDKGSVISITYAIYKRIPLRFAINSHYDVSAGILTMVECAQWCTGDNKCLMWWYNKNDKRCKLYVFTLYDQRLKSTYNPHIIAMDSFELKVQSCSIEF